MSLTLPEEYKTVSNPMLVSLSSSVLIEAVVNDTCMPPSNYSWKYAEVSGNIAQTFSNLPQEFQGTGSSAALRISQGWLKPGVYALRAEVLQQSVSEVMYVSAKAAKLMAIIAGGTTRTVTTSKTVQLDGSSKSYDPDNRTNPLSFSWSCKEGMENSLLEATNHFSLTDCPALLHNITVEKIGMVNLITSGYTGTVTVRMGVSVDTRAAFYDQVIKVVEQFVPTTTIRYV